MQLFTEVGDGFIVSVDQTPLGEERMLEATADAAFDRLAELRAWDEERMHVDAVCVERAGLIGRPLAVDCYQYKVNIGFVPDRIVRQASAKNHRQDGPILLYFFDKRLQSGVELLMGSHSSAAATHEYSTKDVLGRPPASILLPM